MDVTKELYAVFQFWLSVGQGAGGSVSLMPQLSRQSIGKMKQAWGSKKIVLYITGNGETAKKNILGQLQHKYKL